MDNKKLNIVFIGRYPFPYGGAMTKRHRYYIDYLAKLHNVDICNVCTWLSDDKRNLEFGIYKDKAKYYNTTLPKKVSSFLAIAKWTNKVIVDRFKPNYNNIAIFCSYVSIEQMPVFIKAKKMGYKVICDVVENYDAIGSDASKLMKLSFAINKHFFYDKVDAFIAISNQIEDAYKKYGKPILKLTNSAPLNSFPQKQNFHNPMNVVYTGTFASKDGLSYLVEGFDLFIRLQGKVAKLFLIGKGKGDPKTENTISNNEQIEKLGYVSDEELEKIQINADLLCMTRCNSAFANYGFPFKLSEYMATGNTVLATSVGDVPLYIKNKVNGLLILPNNSNAICEALTYAYKNPNTCIAIGQKGKETVKKYFDVEKNGEKLHKFIIAL